MYGRFKLGIVEAGFTGADEDGLHIRKTWKDKMKTIFFWEDIPSNIKYHIKYEKSACNLYGQEMIDLSRKVGGENRNKFPKTVTLIPFQRLVIIISC